MLTRLFLRFILPAVAGALLGFMALAYAVQNEPTIPVAFLSVLSPGLKIAEFLSPVQHESLGSTFGGFLRIALGINVAFYFSIFALFAYLIGRRRSR
jgi:hypothetical protein